MSNPPKQVQDEFNAKLSRYCRALARDLEQRFGLVTKSSPKDSKAEANYRNPSDIKGERCENCTFMVDDGTCDKVVGIVQPPAICDYYQSAVTKQDGADLDHAAARADRYASPAKHRAGNYRKGHIIVHGLDIAIEAMRGSVRHGIGKDGTPWKAALPAHYGYIKRTRGADQEQVDVFIGQHPDARLAWIIDQLKTEDQRFDEHKIMLGFPDFAAALHCYVSAFSDGKGLQRIGHITQVTIPQLKRWLRHGDLTKPRSHMVKGRRAYQVKKYNDTQPRVPAGSPDGGEWTSSGGGGSDRAQNVLRLAREVASNLRYPPDKIEVVEGTQTFTVNGRPWKKAGEADLATGIVRLFPDVIPEGGTARVTAHEVEHQKFQAVINTYEKESHGFNTEPNIAQMVRADDSIKDEFKVQLTSKYPIYTALRGKLDVTSLSKDDGVTAYSRDYWDGWQKGTVNSMSAVHETLAEIAAEHMQTFIIPGSSQWRDLYKTVNKLYPKVVGGLKND